MQSTYLKDYRPFPYKINSVNLTFNLQPITTRVTSVLTVQCIVDEPQDLFLNGEQLTLIEVQVDGVVLAATQYVLTVEGLTLTNLPASCTVTIVTECSPQNNTSLTGLYQSNDFFCTQCEAEGFRRITYYPDRPDVLSIFTTTINADKNYYPVLLSNGNLIASGAIDSDNHFATWFDPFLKPCYLFALVAGNLIMVQDHFYTKTHSSVKLQLYVEHENLNKTAHALAALKKAMAWDEYAYGREYDLDRYMIVAVNDFNMGAMENKGLNIFNAKYVLANAETSTDDDFADIDAVVAHEYFHNWSGNRVTCRDWFQLSLKEGFTVFREHEFVEDITCSAVARIDNVKLMRNCQFAEDKSSMSHPVRPSSYQEINNFYTTTIYEKGAELIKMLQIVIGKAKFRCGTDLYFSRHDGQAVTIEDFVQALSDASEIDLQPYLLWYQQSGTPVVKVKTLYNAEQRQFQLHLSQYTPATADQADKVALPIPLQLALFSPQGEKLNLPDSASICYLNEPEKIITFEKINCHPIVSIGRNFSAPVIIELTQSAKDLQTLLLYEDDPVAKWDAGQKLFLQDIINACTMDKPQASKILLETLQIILDDKDIEHSLKAELIVMPTINQLLELLPPADPALLHKVVVGIKCDIAAAFANQLQQLYQALHNSEQYKYEPQQVSMRHLKAVCLHYLGFLPSRLSLIQDLYANANNMTDKMMALRAVNQTTSTVREQLLASFYKQWSHDPLVVNKWLSLCATAQLPGTFAHVKDLLQHKAFDFKNPNKVYALIGGFVSANPYSFHQQDGSTYSWLAEQIIVLDELNPQIAARMVQPFTLQHRITKPYQDAMQVAMQVLRQHKTLSKNTSEIINKTL